MNILLEEWQKLVGLLNAELQEYANLTAKVEELEKKVAELTPKPAETTETKK